MSAGWGSHLKHCLCMTCFSVVVFGSEVGDGETENRTYRQRNTIMVMSQMNTFRVRIVSTILAILFRTLSLSLSDASQFYI